MAVPEPLPTRFDWMLITSVKSSCRIGEPPISGVWEAKEVASVSVHESCTKGAKEKRIVMSLTHCCAPSEGEADDDGERLALGEIERLVDDEGEMEGLGLTEAEALELGDTLGLGLTLGDSLLLGEALAEGESEGEADEDGDTLALALEPAILNAAAIITCRAEAETVAWIVPVAPAVARMASAIASP